MHTFYASSVLCVAVALTDELLGSWRAKLFEPEEIVITSRKNLKWLWLVLTQIPIAYIDVRFFANATEDANKVVEAVQRVLPSDHIEEIEFTKSNLRGHYGNPITLFEAKIKDKEIIRALVENLSSHLRELDKETLRREIHLHAEKGSLYIRLDKQAALHGKLELCTSDPIRIRIRFRKKKNEDIIKICQELGMLT